MNFDKPNKEDLVFEGTWKTSSGDLVKLENSIGTILESEHKSLIGLKFQIDPLGKCQLNPNFNLVERLRDRDGFML